MSSFYLETKLPEFQCISWWFETTKVIKIITIFLTYQKTLPLYYITANDVYKNVQSQRWHHLYFVSTRHFKTLLSGNTAASLINSVLSHAAHYTSFKNFETHFENNKKSIFTSVSNVDSY